MTKPAVGTQTFDSWPAAVAHAKSLLDKGQIKQSEYDGIAAQAETADMEAHARDFKSRKKPR